MPTMMLLFVNRSGRNRFALRSTADTLIERCTRVADLAVEPRDAFDVVREDCQRSPIQQAASDCSSPCKSLDSNSMVTCGSRLCTASTQRL